MKEIFPINEIIPQVKKILNKNSTLIVQASPGAGKSTILPLEIFRESFLNNKKIIMLEPRRLAAKSVAVRMAALLNENVGKTVGYRIRFEKNVSSHTKIEVVTEGILTRILQNDNALNDYGMVIFDEFHERSLHTDLSLALCLQTQQILRADLKIVIMSATFNAQKLSEMLNDAPIVSSSGKQFPVTLKYIENRQDEWIHLSTVNVIKSALKDESGDMLVFLPGIAEINKVFDLLESENNTAAVCKLYGDLSFQKQQEALLPHPYGKRKIVLSTSIAETSLTIEGITTVIDTGYMRVNRFDPRNGFTKLVTEKVSKDAADQRAGRAGRLTPGTCYRLWNEVQHIQLKEERTPEILEADLSSVLLEVYKWGVNNIYELQWLTPPSSGNIAKALSLLEDLHAIKKNKITDRGKKMAQLPVHPRIGHLMLEASEKDLKTTDTYFTSLGADIAAILDERDPLDKLKGIDIVDRINALRNFRNGQPVNADRGVLNKIKTTSAVYRKMFDAKEMNETANEYDVGELLSKAYPERIAKQDETQKNKYKLANGKQVIIPQHDALINEKWLAVAQLDAGIKEGKVFQAAPLHPDSIRALAVEQKVVFWDEERKMVAGKIEKRIGSIVLESKEFFDFNQEKRIEIICEQIKLKGIKMLEWGTALTEWQSRVMSLKMWRPEEQWPDVSDERLSQTVDVWLSPFLLNISKLSEINKLDAIQILNTLLHWELQNKLERLAPAKIMVPSGSFIKINYHTDGSKPELAVRLQEVFGWLETPSVNEGKTILLMQLLSPAYRVVQITQDLSSFWKNTYSEVRKDLRGQYPKHYWPEDPYQAEAVKGVKKKK